jgi:hypothetical protein
MPRPSSRHHCESHARLRREPANKHYLGLPDEAPLHYSHPSCRHQGNQCNLVHGRNCNIRLHMRRRCAHVVVVKVVVSQGDPTMTPLSWILIAMDVNASDIDWVRWNALARMRPSNCENTLVKGSLGCNSLCNFPTIASNVSECRLAIEYSATTLDSTTELRMMMSR